MSKLLIKPIQVPEGIDVSLNDELVTLKKSSSSIESKIPSLTKVEYNQGQGLKISLDVMNNQSKTHAGTFYRSLVETILLLQDKKYEKTLLLSGVGYRAQVSDNKLVMNLGYSHPVELEIPQGVEVSCKSQTEILVSGTNKQLVGSFSALVKSKRPIEPYNAKGISILGQFVYRKEAKKKK